jgi:hypothetical protein
MQEITKTIRVGSVNVQLWWHQGARAPHAFECTHDNTTNVSGYHRVGGLTFNGIELVDYDGVSELPKAVCVALDLEGLDASYAQ